MRRLKYLSVILFFFYFFACTSYEKIDYEKDDYQLINKVIGDIELSNKDKKGLFLLSSMNKLFLEDFFYSVFADSSFSKLSTGLYVKPCIEQLKNRKDIEYDLSFWERQIQNFKNQKWDSTKIETRFDKGPILRKAESTETLSQRLSMKNNPYTEEEWGAVMWERENESRLVVSATKPFYFKDKNLAFIAISVLNTGQSYWFFERDDNGWQLLCKADISAY